MTAVVDRCWFNFGATVRDLFLRFFRSCGRLGASSVFDRLPKRIPCLFGGEASKKPSERESQRDPKTDPEKDTVLGSGLDPFFASCSTLGAVLGHFVAVLPPLGPRGPNEGGPTETKSRPRAAQVSPRES